MAKEKPKASEVIANADYLLAKKVDSFADAYPSVAKLKIEVQEVPSGFSRAQDPWYLSETNFRHAVDCSNPECYGGGIEVGWILHDVVREKKTDFEITKRCRGYEGTKTKKRRSCMNHFRVKMQIEYKEQLPA